MNLPKPQIDRDAAMELWIKDRSNYAKEQLLLNNTGIVGFVLKKMSLNPLDEDLFSTGMIGVVKAINTFDVDKNIKFVTYAETVVRNEILMILKKKKIIPSFSFDETCNLDNGDEACYADIIADTKRFEEEVIAKATVRKILEHLNENEKKIIQLKIEGKNQTQIAEICGISQSQVSRVIRKIYKKCRKFN